MGTTSVTSEALQLKLRQLLPSQQGFGTDISASDTIIPIIDLTAAAEGSDVAQNLQTALGFQDLTGFAIANTTTTIANAPGFYRVFGTSSLALQSGSICKTNFLINDGSTTKEVYQFTGFQSVTPYPMFISYDFIVFLRAGDSLEGSSTNTASKLNGTSRQIADSNGSLVQPAGFTPQ